MFQNDFITNTICQTSTIRKFFEEEQLGTTVFYLKRDLKTKQCDSNVTAKNLFCFLLQPCFPENIRYFFSRNVCVGQQMFYCDC